MDKGFLVLETGDVFEGILIGDKKAIEGELVFNTGMTGYQEMMTDPSYKGQILTFCYPIIGNYGINDIDDESKEIAVSAVIASDICDEPSHYQLTRSFSNELEKAGIPGLFEIDTRQLVMIIREHGSLRAKIVNEESETKNVTWQTRSLLSLVNSVSVKQLETYGTGELHIAIMDFGYKKSIRNALLQQGCKVTVVPYQTPLNQIKELNLDGIILSNGPGDPMELQAYFPVIKQLTEDYPTLGICLGHQLIALAYGAMTKKMHFGHRGGNHPVKDLFTGKVWVTSQNHGYVVEEDTIDYNQFNILFKNVNDRSLEGLKHCHYPVTSVQFHPEAHPGPSDTNYIFEDFLDEVREKKGALTHAKA
ncbi:carbamoyl phosphate synthase small subunit [Oceanobacillus sp. 1P07AA]|uniref:carbamoyl phosphate synthase small subunit n=1 Tax=Oceanobacillus sp. 1P07AA TaxID=3132293 RepID=UPI0039A4DB18